MTPAADVCKFVVSFSDCRMPDVSPEPQRPRFILHVGPPKTGSTTLQESVFSAVDRAGGPIAFIGKPWFNPDVPYDKCVGLHRAIDDISKRAEVAYDEDSVAAAVADYLRHAPQVIASAQGGHPRRCLLSEERLCITDVVPLDIIARRLAAVFGNAEIVYVRRDPVAALLSGHKWLYARAWIDESFDDWIARGVVPGSRTSGAVALRYYDWPLLEAVFGRHFSTVRGVDLDLLTSDDRGFLAAFLNVDRDEPALGPGLAALRARPPLNVSRNRAVSELHRITKKSIRLWNRVAPSRRIDEKPEYLGEGPLWSLCEAPLRRLSLGEGKFRVTDAARQAIADYYGSDRA